MSQLKILKNINLIKKNIETVKQNSSSETQLKNRFKNVLNFSHITFLKVMFPAPSWAWSVITIYISAMHLTFEIKSKFQNIGIFIKCKFIEKPVRFFILLISFQKEEIVYQKTMIIFYI